MAQSSPTVAGRLATERGGDRFAQRRDADDVDAADVVEVVRRGRLLRGTIARVKPSRAASRSRASEAVDGPQLAGQADLAAQHGPGTSGRSRSAEARARASGRSIAGSSTLEPPTTLA